MMMNVSGDVGSSEIQAARLFVGLPLPEAYQRGLARLTAALRPLVPGACSWTKPGNWHLTLAFLGDVPLERIPELGAALAGVTWDPFGFRAGGGGFFPSPECPRVLWVGAAEGGRPCRELAWAVKEALAPLGLGQEARPFAAHLTLARIRSSRPRADWKGTLDEVQKAQWPLTVMERFILWRSYLGEARKAQAADSAGAAGSASGGQPGPRYLPMGEFEASG